MLKKFNYLAWRIPAILWITCSILIFLVYLLSFLLDTNWLWVITAVFLALALPLLTSYILQREVFSKLLMLKKQMLQAKEKNFLLRSQNNDFAEINQLTSAFDQVLSDITTIQVKEIENTQDLEKAQKTIKEQSEELILKNKLHEVAAQLKISNANLEKRIKAQDLLMEAAHYLAGALNKRVIIKRLAKLVRDKMQCYDFAVFLIKKRRSHSSLRCSVASGVLDVKQVQNLSLSLGEGVTGMVAQSGAPYIVEDISTEKNIKLRKIYASDNLPLFLQQGSMLCVPMIYRGRVMGVINFFSPKKKSFEESDVTLYYALGALASLSLINAELYESILKLATLDPLTNLLNKRAMHQSIEKEVLRSLRFKNTIALLMIDVDYFKGFNDRMGHLLGDKALKEISFTLKKSLRRVDSIGRFGGEEFCAILPQTDERSALLAANKLRSAISKIAIEGSCRQPFGHLSVSIGVSVLSCCDLKDTKEVHKKIVLQLLNHADKALYSAKAQGRNKVVAV